MAKKKSAKIDLRKSIVERTDGSTQKTNEWLQEIADKLPSSFRHKKGKRKGKVVNHYEQLKKVFKEKGQAGVLEYTEQCYDMLTDAVKEEFA